MPQTTNTDLIQMLKAAAEDEHAALIQYLRHAYMMGEGELACEIEAIAREEMRHFWILSRWIVRLGDQPTTQRGFTDVSGVTPPEWMQRDVAAEERAIAMYEGYLTRITDPDLRADIEHILADERRHHGDFTHFVDKTALAMQQAPTPEAAAAPAPGLPSGDQEALNWGVNHEYAAILQYLVHSFLTMDKDEEISSQLMTQAINEMQHMGWFGEELAGSGAELPLTHHPLTLPADPQAMLEADVQLENETAAMYGQFIAQMTDPGAKGVIEDARGQELYHEALFGRLLKRLKPVVSPAAAPTTKVWTVGTLKHKK
ncbi:MAG TPA: ferritin-like domain-containing protein [Anaerolineae bacterium]|nr:ferritin-like domain-containing protein [Anaerolineae bacterium]HQK14995.1 ferritin-like domain-containing protein [Anaerolineae bacterium]